MAETQVDLTTIPISPEGGNVPAIKAGATAEDITVFHDKENFTVKHPLMHTWTLWFTKPASGRVRYSSPVLAAACYKHTDKLCRATTGTNY